MAHHQQVSKSSTSHTEDGKGETSCGCREAGLDQASRGASGAGWVALPVFGALVCCGGPAVASWLAASGLMAALGAWWSHDGIWWGGAVGMAVLMGGGAGYVRRGLRP